MFFCMYKWDKKSWQSAVNVFVSTGCWGVLHSHITTEEPPGGAEPDPHSSREGSYRRSSQPQLWSATSSCSSDQNSHTQLCSLRYFFFFAVLCIFSSRYWNLVSPTWHMFLLSSGGRNFPRSLLGSSASGDSEGSLFAVPTTLPPNSSRHNRMFSPNKEAQLAFRQQLDSISVGKGFNTVYTKSILNLGTQIFLFYFIFLDAVRSFPLQTEKTSKQTTSKAPCSSGKSEGRWHWRHRLSWFAQMCKTTPAVVR